MSYTLVKAHRFVAVGLGLFIVSHFAIHLSAMGGVEVHLTWLKRAGWIYSNPIIEPLLIFAILVQVFIGTRLVRRRWKLPGKGFWGWAQIISGLYLAMFLLVHISAALITRYFVGLETNFYWAAGTLNVGGLKYIFAPYYFFGVLSVFTHLAAAMFFGWRGKGPYAIRLIFGFGFIIAAVIVATFAGVFYEINLPKKYIEYYESFYP